MPNLRQALITLFVALAALIAAFYVMHTLQEDTSAETSQSLLYLLTYASITFIILFNIVVIVLQQINIHRLTHAQSVLSQALSLKEEALKALARFDEVTGLMNRANFDEELYDEWRRCYRERKPLSLILLRLSSCSFPKESNSVEEEQLLAVFSQTLKASSLGHRAGDYLARYDHDTFGIVLSNCPHKDLSLLCLRLEKHCKETAPQITFTLAGATLDMQGERPPMGEIITLAEQALEQVGELGADHPVVLVSKN